MTMHMAVVAVAAPLLALAWRAPRSIRCAQCRASFAPIPASMIELVVVWAWHVPALHQAARHEPCGARRSSRAVPRRGSAALDRGRRRRPRTASSRAGAGVVALLFTSMHMTLLGALFALANRPLFQHAPSSAGLSPVADQQLGGAIMLLVGGASYLVGGLWLTAVALRPASSRRVGRQGSTV